MSLSGDSLHAIATSKATRRLLPILGIAYFMSYVDRTNVSLAKTQLEADVGISAAAYGLGAGIFFVSYALLEVPSNMVLYKVGARAWITRIAVSWGLVSAAMMFVQGEMSFYILRFLLGAAEAGLYPALMYLVTVWFAPEHRVKVVGLIYTSPALAIIFGGPIGGALMELDGVGGLYGWQWMFLVEGLFTAAVGLVVWTMLPSKPADATWLTAEEATILTERAQAAATPSPERLHGNLRLAFGRPIILVLAGIYFFNQTVGSAVGFNLPSIIEAMGVSNSFHIGLIAGSMGIAALAGVLAFPWMQGKLQSDTELILACTIAATAAMAGYMTFNDPIIRLVILFLTNFFVIGTLPLFWSVAMSRMSGLMAAVGLAFVNMVGLFGGFFGPLVFGALEENSGKNAPFIFVLSCCLAGIVLAVTLRQMISHEKTKVS